VNERMQAATGRNGAPSANGMLCSASDSQANMLRN
jgi:hypothetical protein